MGGDERVKQNIEFKHFAPGGDVRKLIEELMSRLDKHLKDFNGDSVFLRIVIEENAVRTLYQVSVTLALPRKTIAAKEERHDVRETLRDAFAEIQRQIDKHKASMRREHLWKRIARRESQASVDVVCFSG